MNKWLRIYFLFSVITGTLIYFAQRFSFPLPRIIQFYVNDFLIVPIILTVSLYFLRWSKNNASYQIPLWIVLYLSGLYTIIFEVFLPRFHPRYTADHIDIILYFASGFIFYMLQKK